MKDTISVDQLRNLRNDFKAYLRETNPQWNENTFSARCSDAFFALNYNVGFDFWASLVNEESLLAARDKIRDYLASTRGSKRPDELANGYLYSLQLLKAFLDAKHPNLPSDWSGKAVSNVNLKVDFQTWMKTQKKPNGENYSPSTIITYASALKNATAKLGLGDSVNSDLFFYTSADEFEEVHQTILAAPNFAEIDMAAGNKAYSNSLILYAKFLKEQGELSAWIFQGNPKYYDVIAAVEALDSLTWAVNQYKRQIKNGDRAYIWLSGTDGGIIASGTIMCAPEMREPNLNDPYNRGEALKTSPYLAVDIRIERKLTLEKVSRAVLLADERTKQLEILTYPGATNFRVTKTQMAVIESLIDGSYERVPALDEPKVEVVGKRRYWLYSPGEQARLWDEFYNDGIMGIGWDRLGELTGFTSKLEVQSKMMQLDGGDRSYMNDALALWQFANDISIGDVIFVKKGRSLVLGRGIVTSEYIYDSERKEFQHIRKVNWTQKGEWKHPGLAAIKALTDITQYTEYVEKLESLFVGDEIFESDDEPEINPDYSADDFLFDVYISKERYDTLKGLLLRKKNLILQGAPGVGKTFAAQRLAFSIIGQKDEKRVKIIQFHQSYSYEDFVMGYRPDGDGFRLAEGPFYKFCKKAEKDNENEYFFIIDEINRGNLSKIFGELLMLIEGDKRGEKNSLRLLYKDEQFSVPDNIYLIGMMNTADRSLAMIDYALRRRFAFFDMEPAFSSDGFKARQATIQNPKFDALVAVVESLNKVISEDASLGLGYRIGHSYFCTNDEVNQDWLSSVIEYELLPLLHEYWFDEPSKVESWTSRLRSALNA